VSVSLLHKLMYLFKETNRKVRCFTNLFRACCNILS